MPAQEHPIPANPAANGGGAAIPYFLTVLKWAIVAFPLAYLWFRLISNLMLEWTTNPQYGYCLLVPFLCLGLLIRRWHDMRTTGLQTTDPSQNSVVGGQISNFSSSAVLLLLCALAFLYLPTRLVEAATPEWRPIQWSLGIIAIGLTLCVIYAHKGGHWLKQLAFPVCFFFVAIPWPTLFETPIIQTLTRVSSVIVVEVIGWLGVPAVAHGNVIEVSTGMVGIDEACSGIRSFQTSLMISLFFGEFYRLGSWRRWLLIPMGFVFSMAFNVCRMSLLTLVAARKGVAAISEYHDPAGITIAILCTLGLWGLAFLLKRSERPISSANPDGIGPNNEKSENRDLSGAVKSQSSAVHDRAANSPAISPQSSALNNVSLSLLAWLVLVESGVHAWYHFRESHLQPGPEWTVNFPQDNPTLTKLTIDDKTRYLLRFDEGKQAAWTEPDGIRWQGFYFRWLPGRVAGYLAKRHTPEICLTATGIKLVSGPNLEMMTVHGLALPIRCYVFQTEAGIVQVFHCRWEAGAGEDAYVTHESARYNLVRAIWAGRGNHGQRVLEFVAIGIDDPEQAKLALIRQLEKLVVVEPTQGTIGGK